MQDFLKVFVVDELLLLLPSGMHVFGIPKLKPVVLVSKQINKKMHIGIEQVHV